MKKRNLPEKSFIGGENYILIVFFAMCVCVCVCHSQNDFFAVRDRVF